MVNKLYVMCLVDHEPVSWHTKHFTKGKIYEVTEISKERFYMIDDRGKPNGWDHEFFRIIKNPNLKASKALFEKT